MLESCKVERRSMDKTVNSAATLTWLQAAEQVLREEGPEMHIRDLTLRVLELGIVKSSCATSLETLLYRQTSGGPSKFIRVPGKHGWFGLRTDLDNSTQPMMETSEDNNDITVIETQQNSATKPRLRKDTELDFEPRVFYTSTRKRRLSYPSSDESTSLESSDEGAESGDISTDEEELVDDSVYKKKYEFVKKVAKSMIHGNAALASQISVIHEKITRAEEERTFLLNKLVHFERTAKPRLLAPPPLTFVNSKSIEHNPQTTKHTFKSNDIPAPPPLLKSDNVPYSPKIQSSQSSTIIKASNASLKSEKPTPVSVSSVKTLSSSKARSLVMSGSESDNSDSEGEAGRLKIVSSQATSSKVKKFKGHIKKSAPIIKRDDEDGDEQLELAMRSGKVRRLHPIPLNEDGSPVFPIVVGGLRVQTLGQIVYDRPAYHSERYLLPVGFESSRSYPSMIDPSKKCLYTCKILDGGEAPVFEMVAEDDPDHPVRAASSTACQTIVLRNINKARDKQATNSGSGPEFFGYSNPTILNLLQKMPDAKKCTKYKFVRFAEPKRSKKATVSKPAKKPSPSRLNLLKKTLIKKAGAQKRKFPTKTFCSRPRGGGGGRVKKSVATVETSSLAIAPVGSGPSAYGMETTTISYSSSDDLSSSSENELVIDS